MTPLEAYLHSLAADRNAATPESGHYAALAGLINEIGATLTPAMRAVTQPQNIGYGIPDLAIFSERQDSSLTDQLPEGGVVEAKPFDHDLLSLAHSDQVRRYAEGYGMVLVTNYYQFMVVCLDERGALRFEERYDLAPDPATLWQNWARLAKQHEKPFTEFLLRALRRKAPINTPRDLAWLLASYARAALHALNEQPTEALKPLKAAMYKALGIQFTDEEGDHFFRSSLVQTLFYGLFSAWIAYNALPDQARPQRFRWQDVGDYLSLPLLAELFESIARPRQLRELAIRDLVEWAEAALHRVQWEAFSRVFDQDNAINYFYEPFLEAYDPDLRRQLGVWYTPPEVVRYMVRRVDRALRTELNLPNGLADERVIVLDPCCGTGAYLLETLRCIQETLAQQGKSALLGATLKKAACERILGFEIMPAPFVVAHMQINTLLSRLGNPLRDPQRAAIYLTNALSGWQARGETDPLQIEGFPKLRQEALASLRLKREEKILVVIGNPPYNGYAGVAVQEESELLAEYRTPKRAPRPQGQGLNDLYVRFFRVAERKIVEDTGRGIVCFISNYSWLDGLSHTGMRERYLEVFDRVVIDNLNGDRYRTGKLTPDGKPDPSIFSSEHNREGIQVGTAIATLIRTEPHRGAQTVLYRDLWGAGKLRQLAAEAAAPPSNGYTPLQPMPDLGFPFMPRTARSDYLSWARLPDLLHKYFPGVKTSRDEDLVEIDRDVLEQRMRAYFNPKRSDEDVAKIAPALMRPAYGFDPVAVRRRLLERGFRPENIVRYVYRPFDVRWLYWEDKTSLLRYRSPDHFPTAFEGNLWLEVRQRESSDTFNRGTVVSVLADNFGNGMSLFVPLYLKPESKDTEAALGRAYNLSVAAQNYLDGLGVPPETLFFHVIAILHAPAYRSENSGALRQDFPRIPLPQSADLLLSSAELGRRVAALLDSERAVAGVTEGEIAADLRAIAEIVKVGGGQIDSDQDLSLTVNWGVRGKNGVVMPGRGRVSAAGENSLNIYLNERVYWANVPKAVWEYTLGGYQVLKKWLSYREKKILGRSLRLEEAETFTEIARRIAALLALSSDLDANYRACVAAAQPIKAQTQ